MPITLIRTPAMAGPITRAPLKIIELSAIALGKSSRPTISTTKVWRAGMSKAVTRPLTAARMITYSTRTDAGPGQRRQDERAQHQQRLGGDDQPAAIGVVDHHAGEQRHQQHRQVAGEADHAEHQGGVGELEHQPSLRHRLHPGADERDELAAEEQPEIAMAQRAEGAEPRRRVGSDWTGAAAAGLSPEGVSAEVSMEALT